MSTFTEFTGSNLDTYTDHNFNRNSPTNDYGREEDYSELEIAEEEILLLQKRLTHEQDKSKALLSELKKIKAIMIVTVYDNLSESEVNQINEVLKPY